VSGDARTVGGVTDEGAEEDALDAAVDDEVSSDAIAHAAIVAGPAPRDP
jgi:hypothetical protein